MSAYSLYDMLCDVLGNDEAMKSHWIARARQQPRLLERVLAEVKMLKQERRITKSPAAAANDLWQRWAKPDEFNVVEIGEI